MNERKLKNIKLAIQQAKVKKDLILEQISQVEEKEKNLSKQKSALKDKISQLELFISSQEERLKEKDSAEK